MDYSSENIEHFRWPISVSRPIQASPQQIWLAISKPGNLNDCHPFCASNPVSAWPGVGSVDTIHYYSGWVFRRRFVRWIDKVGYDLLVGRPGGRKSYVSWRISGAQDDHGTLGITIYPHALQNIPSAVRWIPHILVLRPALQSYLEAVVRGFEWFITTGKPVKKNQFGSHKWFSGNYGEDQGAP